MRRRKVVLRLGYVAASREWTLKPGVLRALLAGRSAFAALTDDDFDPGFRQKGVDMRIGLDIASLAYKRLVDQIVLISGDGDFVPAAKLARREGIDFVLDAMGQPIHEQLRQHIDELRAVRPGVRDHEIAA